MTEHVSVSQARRVPGEPGIWVFISLDMLVFAEMFGVFAYYRGSQRDVFRTAQEATIPAFGLTYTILLLTSSWCVAMALKSLSNNLLVSADKYLTWAVRLGTTFAMLKPVEYLLEVSAGHSPHSNDFFMLYFVMTFVHLVHVCAGLAVLAYMRRGVRAFASPDAPPQPPRHPAIEAGAIYWHMVDLLWMFLFALFYLRS